jgi:hypothetical protein
MKRSFTIIIITLILFAATAVAEPLGTGFTYQGELKQQGVPANGSFDFEFNLFDVAVDGISLTAPFQLEEISVQDGVFTVELDFGTDPYNGEQLWLDIKVREGASTGGYTALLPRQKLTSSPYALEARIADLEAQVAELQGPPGGIRPIYLNGLLEDANGKVVGFWWYDNFFVSTKGYWFHLYYPSPGYYTNQPVFFESDDCTGQPYTQFFNPNPLPGKVFVAHDGFDSHYVAYTEIGAIPTTRTTNSLRRYNGVYGHGYCETPKTYTDEYVPVYPNDPEITGIPGDVGNRDNPYPTPLSIVN